MRIRWVVLALLFAAADGRAEQLQRFGNWTVHYVVIPSTFLRPQIAQRYDLVRAANRALVNVSLLDGAGTPARANVQGRAMNLLGQTQTLAFRQVEELPAVYYLAELEHSNEETMRFTITLTPQDGKPMLLEFQQKLYWEDSDARGAR